MDISFIVPVYNTKQVKLNRCFESIKQIEELETECLIIDDGSNERTGFFCKEFAEKNSGFFYIHKENGGVSSARNLGLKKANGDYIFFVDSDDELCPIAFVKKYYVESSDLVFTNIALVDKEKKYQWRAFDKKNGTVSVLDVLQRVTTDGTLNGPCGKLICREFIIKNQLFFDEEMISGEDVVFLLKILKCNPKMNYFNVTSYYYFKELETGSKRLMEHSKVYIDNNVTMYTQVCSIIECEMVSDSEKQLLISKATQRFIKQIFNSAADLLMNKKLNDNLKQEIVASLKIIDNVAVKECKVKSQLQYKIIIKKQWKYLSAIAKIRYMYLKIKGIK